MVSIVLCVGFACWVVMVPVVGNMVGLIAWAEYNNMHRISLTCLVWMVSRAGELLGLSVYCVLAPKCKMSCLCGEI